MEVSVTQILFYLVLIAIAAYATKEAFPREKLGDRLHRLRARDE